MKLEWVDSPGTAETLRVRAPAKVNLRLEILGERPDGFHEIDSVFLTVSLHDTIEFRRADDSMSLELEVIAASGSATGTPGPALPGVESNLVLRAAGLLREHASRQGGAAGRGCGLSIRLHKAIPLGAGLGGGSSDAAATLVALDRLWHLDLEPSRLVELAAELGSDVPFFLRGGLARVRGRGERVDALVTDVPPESFHAVLVSPSLEVPTALVYKKLRSLREEGISLTRSAPLNTMKIGTLVRGIREGRFLRNDLQAVAFLLFPELRRLHDVLERESFVGVLMTGSGSTLFGLCRGRDEAREAAARLRHRLLVDTGASGSGHDRIGIRTVHGLSGWPEVRER